MLIPIEQANLTDGQKFSAMLGGWSAVDTDTGAYLRQQRNGGGWILIIPHSRPDDLLDPGDNWDRRRFRATGEREAIRIGNQKLAEWIDAQAVTV